MQCLTKKNEFTESNQFRFMSQKIPEIRKKQSPMEINISNTRIFTPTIERANAIGEVMEIDNRGTKIAFFDGKPSVTALSALIALLAKSPRNKDGKIDREKLKRDGIMFKFADLCKALGLKNIHKTRQLLYDDLNRLSGLTVQFRYYYSTVDKDGKINSITDKKEQKRPFRIEFYGKKYDKSKVLSWTNKLFLEDFVLDSFENNGYRLIPTDKFLSLSLPTAKLIANLILVHNQTGFWEIGLLKLAEHIFISTKIERSTKQVISKASKQLKEQALIKDFEFRKTEEGETIIKYIFR